MFLDCSASCLFTFLLTRLDLILGALEGSSSLVAGQVTGLDVLATLLGGRFGDRSGVLNGLLFFLLNFDIGTEFFLILGNWHGRTR